MRCWSLARTSHKDSWPGNSPEITKKHPEPGWEPPGKGYCPGVGRQIHRLGQEVSVDEVQAELMS